MMPAIVACRVVARRVASGGTGFLMAKRSRRQHTVSKFYLRAFADESGIVRRIEVPSRETIDLSVNNASLIKDFYSVRLPDGSMSDIFEKAFASIEDGAAAAHSELLGGKWPLHGDARMNLAEWIALQHLRTEGTRGGHEVMRASMIRLVVGISGKEALRRHIESAETRTVTDEELDLEWHDLTKPGGPDLAPDVLGHMDTVLSLLPGFASYVHDCHWTLFRFRRRCLVTSDHPVSLVVGPEHPPFLGVGIANAELFLVPMSRRFAITIQPRHRLLDAGFPDENVPDFTAPVSTKAAMAINQETAARARQYIYHHPADTPLQGLWIREDGPVPGMQEPDLEHFIRPEGIFSDAPTDDDPRPLLDDGDSDGFSLSDLPWPIPGRRPPAGS
jgi:hypothetical protein